MCFCFVFEAAAVCFYGSFSHDGLTDDQGRAFFLEFGFCQGGTDLGGVVACDGDHTPAPCRIFGGYIFFGHFAGLGRELDAVGVVEHDQVVESEVARCTACSL